MRSQTLIIGVCGLIGSGKDTIADYLISEHNFQKISFADKLKDSVGVMFGWSRDMLDGKTTESREWREKVDEFCTKETGRTITPRLVLQEFGTECMRNGFYDGIWVSLVKQKIIDNPNINWVLPDTRFPNEAKMLHEVGGHVWRVKRGQDPKWFTEYVEFDTEPNDVHPSEWAWAHTKFSQTLENNGTIDELRSQVANHLASI